MKNAEFTKSIYKKLINTYTFTSVELVELTRDLVEATQSLESLLNVYKYTISRKSNGLSYNIDCEVDEIIDILSL